MPGGDVAAVARICMHMAGKLVFPNGDRGIFNVDVFARKSWSRRTAVMHRRLHRTYECIALLGSGISGATGQLMIMSMFFDAVRLRILGTVYGA